MSALDVEIRRRNARLLAWRESGVSVEGQWVRVGAIVVVHISCSTCREGQSHRFLGAPAGMPHFERQMILKILEVGCCHLKPLLQSDPKEIVSRAQLELFPKNS